MAIIMRVLILWYTTHKNRTTATEGYLTFWRHLEANHHPDLIVRCFRPPRLEGDSNDLYDAVSYALYDVHDWLQAHREYLRAMRVIPVYERRPACQRLASYEEAVARVPEECAPVPVILEALLKQVEENLADGLGGEAGGIACELILFWAK